MNPFTLLQPSINPQFFHPVNVSFIQSKVTETLARDFRGTQISIDRESIVREMIHVITLRHESVPRMNQRVVMELCNIFRNHQVETHKHLDWSENYIASQKLVNLKTRQTAFDSNVVRGRTHRGTPMTGGTMQFVTL